MLPRWRQQQGDLFGKVEARPALLS